MLNTIHSTKNVQYNTISVLCILFEPVFTYSKDLNKYSAKAKGRNTRTNRLYLAALTISNLRSEINIRDIPQPGQSFPVTKLKMQGIAMSVSIENAAYNSPAIRTIEVFLNILIKRFFCSSFIYT